MIDEATALLPCPFCGGDAEMDTQQGYEYSKAGVHRIGRRVTIYCRECPADLGICHEDVPDHSTDDLVSQVTEMWNKRAALRAQSGAPSISTAPSGAQQEQHDDNEGNGRRARGMAGEGHAGDAGSGGSANDIDGNNGAAQRDAGLLRSLAHGDSRQGNAAKLTTDKPAALARAQSGDALVPGGAMKARLFDLLVAKGRIKLCCDQLHRGNLGTRCAWIEFPLSDAMDISVEAYDAALAATQGAGKI